jgi:ABC-2 type transport system ATP-binding protein
MRFQPSAPALPARPTTSVKAAIKATGLTKSFGGQQAVRDLHLSVPAGNVLALIGPNGSGKTTTVRMLSTLLAPDSGRAMVAGHDVTSEGQAVRAAIGVTGQFSAVDGLLTGRQNLVLMARLHHLSPAERQSRVGDQLDRFDLTDAADKPVAIYSGGMRRRLDLAMTLMTRPEVVFLDEPTTGLDPRGRQALWQIVRELATDGVTVLLTTQYLEEADRLADRVALLEHGRLIAEGTPAELKARAPGGHVRLSFANEAAASGASALLPGAYRADDGMSLVLPSDNSVAGLRSLLDRLQAAAVPVTSVSAQPADLDDVFFALTGDER